MTSHSAPRGETASNSPTGRGAQAHALASHGTPKRGRDRRAIPTAELIAANAKLPSYCDRAPAALLDDGWSSDVIETRDSASDSLLDMDAMDDFDVSDFYDSGDIEDSR